jgi:nucleoside-diphosphate-sugar epimerase
MTARALVTGSSGFVGRHMAAELARRGWDVAGVDIAEGFDALEHFRFDTRWDLVVHAAASAPHRAAIDTEPQHMARNLQLDAAMFDWAVRTGQGRVLYLSSSAAYPIEYQRDNGYAEPLYEDMTDLTDAQEPDSVYGWTKLTGERMAAEARKAGLRVTVVRPFSGYGEDQSEDFPFRALIERARRREDPFVIWGNGDQVRDWIHIDDVIGGALAVVESGSAGPVNLCTGVGFSVAELAYIACDQVGHKPRFEYLADKPAGVAYRVGNPAVLHNFYRPRISLPEGVARALQDQKQPL